MNTTLTKQLRESTANFSEKIPYLKMLVLFGSHAKGDTHENGDCNFAVLYTDEILKMDIEERSRFYLEGINTLAETFDLDNDSIELIELNNCSALTAHFVARDGIPLYEKQEGIFQRFQEDALMSAAKLQQIEDEFRNKTEFFLREWNLL